MKTLTEAEFLQWAAARHLRPADSYPESVKLHYESQPEPPLLFWRVPSAPERRPYFFATMLDGLGDWAACFVWRHSGSWPSPDEVAPEDDTAVVEHRILSGLGLPLGTADVLQFSRAERDSLLTLLFTTSAFGWAVIHDLYVVPDHAREFLTVSHHDKVFVAFGDDGDPAAWDALMSQRGMERG